MRHNPYATPDDRELARDAGITVAQLRADRKAQDVPPIPKPVKSITVIGRRWFQRTYGNTYHTAEILIDGVTVHKTARAYGYGSQYEDSAAAWLEAQGVIKRKAYANGGHSPLWQVIRDEMGLNWQSTALDVARERDL